MNDTIDIAVDGTALYREIKNVLGLLESMPDHDPERVRAILMRLLQRLVRNERERCDNNHLHATLLLAKGVSDGVTGRS